MERPINFFNQQPTQPEDQGPVLVAIEGLDASGKQTQTKALVDALGAATLAFPNYATPTGQLIQGFLKDEVEVVKVEDRDRPYYEGDSWGFLGNHENALALQALMTVNRYEVQHKVMAELTLGRSVVLDRYYMSGVIYGQYDGLDPNWLYAIHGALLKPDLYVYLDISVAESMRRRPVREDAYEANEDRLGVVRGLYNKTWKRAPFTASWRMKPTRWLIVDGTQDKDTITKVILAEVAKIRRGQ